MSDTPETDAAVKDSDGQWSFVLKEACQRLERERDQARKGQMEALCDCQRLARKIDDIRDVFDHQDEDWTGSTTLAKAVSKVIRERDDLRKQLNAATSALRQIHLEVGDWIRFTVIGDEK